MNLTPRHSEIIVRELASDIAGGPTITSPGVKRKPPENDDDDPALDATFATRYRRLVARANYMALDRCDILFAVKELCRGMASPCHTHWLALLRLARFLRMYPRFVVDYEYQKPTSTLHVFVDSDLAGEHPGRKSTSGGAIQLGHHLLKTWASTQQVIALSSGEAELYSIIKGSTQALGMKSLLQDLQHGCRLRIFTDSTSGKAIASRRGLGRVRHIDVSELWIQSKVRDGSLELIKLNNKFNSADAFTKFLSFSELVECLRPLGGRYADGRHPLAPELHSQETDVSFDAEQ